MQNGSTPLHSAVRSYNGNLSSVKLLLEQNNSSINVGNVLGETPLHLAARCNPLISEDLIRLLLKHGADVTVTNVSRDTPLHLLATAYHGHFSKTLIECILEHGADVNAVNIDGNTPLHVAGQNKDFYYLKKVSECLLQHGANVNAKNKSGDTPLHLAARFSERFFSNKVIELLIKYGADVGIANLKGETPFHLLFLQHQLSTFLHISTFIKKSGKVNVRNANGETPLHLAVRKRCFCNVTLIKLFLDYGADVSMQDALGENVYEAYRRALAKDDRKPEPMLEILLRSSEQQHVNSSLHVASLFHNVDSVHKLLKRGANVNAIDGHNYSPLLYALITHADKPEKIADKCSTVKLLLDYGADINHEFSSFHVPLVPVINRVEGSILGIMHFGIQGMDRRDILATREPFFQHMAKLLTLSEKLVERGIEVEVLNESNRYYLAFLEDIDRFVQQFNEWRSLCSEELQLMSQTEIDEGEVTFFDLLFATETSTAMYAKNKEMIKAFDAKKCMFPMYQGMLDAKLARDLERRKLIDSAAVAFCNGVSFADPRDAFYERTLTYCSNNDLISLIEAMGGEVED